MVRGLPDRLRRSQQDEPGFEAATQMYVDPEGCFDCGACIPACTSDSIHAIDDVPEDKKDFVEKNAAFYKHRSKRRLPGSTPQLKGDGVTVNQPPPTPSNCIEPRFDLFLALTFFSFPRYRRANECRQSDPQFRGVVGSSD